MPGQYNFFDTARGNIPMPAVTTAVIDPTASNDISQGIIVGSTWINTANSRVWQCMSNSLGAAVWSLDAVVPGVGIMPSTTITQFGSGAATFFEEGNIVRQISGTGINPGATGADNVLAVYSLPANSLDIAGRGLCIMAMGSFASNTNVKRVKLVFNPTAAVVGSTVSGGTVIADTGNYSTTGAVGWQLIANTFKYGALGSNTQICLHESAQVGSVVGSLLVPTMTTATESGAILVAVTGNAATATTDIALNLMEIQAMN